MLAAIGRLLLGMALVAACIPAALAAPTRVPVVAAAASVRFALADVADAFQRETGHGVRLSLGSSGNLARQIREGAPYDLFLSADPRYVEDLLRGGFTRDAGKAYLLGRLALIVPHGSPLAADGSLADLRAALADGRVRRFAIANPEHAPYGQRAEQALRHAGLWDAIRERLVLGENVGQAAQFALSGNAEGGLVGFALARAPALAARASAALVPSAWHAPLSHRAVLLNGADAIARAFFDYLSSPGARALFRRHGFDLPGD
ncbi:MAG: molybdate ABC transporter substrate-binding protein [Gammaproteobacteria bacterium]|nr:molybdate ABC transporter substrate-binding protein [Gammaproteobacteria bacterium]NIM73249.1 molybdate ABC transporter substrate-binding protein [Gammaproteobacteria bacterium]NIO24950.1 molybdate ABC transporter substrate-binding protein [Gammaproteobacteria bacterium]NIO65552.1 molybdate ABC transporter substrate-binding protein [Gammaproteobacteria bacterium]NIP45379.1 molybdate ABC transporter substrate-binding protein [Gammaproteobacteria bacterium]